jgi:hypothetical protein
MSFIRSGPTIVPFTDHSTATALQLSTSSFPSSSLIPKSLPTMTVASLLFGSSHVAAAIVLIYTCLSQACCGQSIPPRFSQTWSVSELTILSISSPQCYSTEAGEALDCVLPAPLTLITSAVPDAVSSSPYSHFLLRIQHLPWLDWSLPVSLIPRSNTTWQCYLLLPGYVRPALNASLAVSFMSAFDYTMVSPTFAGLSILATAPPQLRAISGCTGSGQLTSGCHAEADVLLLYGSGFTWLNAFQSYTINIGPSCTIEQGQGSTSLSVFNDSVAAYRLLNSYNDCAYASRHTRRSMGTQCTRTLTPFSSHAAFPMCLSPQYPSVLYSARRAAQLPSTLLQRRRVELLA